MRRALADGTLALVVALTLACASGPPRERGPFREPDLVELISIPALDGRLRLDIRYATANNFTGRAVYAEPRAFLQRPAAEALARAAQRLAADGYGLLIFDGYRPWRVTKRFWKITPPEKRDFVADPKKGSRHNRGCAVDLSLYDLATGTPVEMPSDYDDFSERAHPNFGGSTPQARANRDRLRAAMEAERFTVYEFEWWHFDFEEWRAYPILDLDFAAIPPPA